MDRDGTILLITFTRANMKPVAISKAKYFRIMFVFRWALWCILATSTTNVGLRGLIPVHVKDSAASDMIVATEKHSATTRGVIDKSTTWGVSDNGTMKPSAHP